MKLRSVFIGIASMALVLINPAGQASPKAAQKATPKKVTTISICTGEHCVTADQAYASELLLNQFQQLFKANEGETVSFCKADDKDHSCTASKVCHFVLGGIIPGNGCSQGIRFTTPEVNLQTAEINMKADMPLTFIGTPLACTTAASSLSIHSANDITLELKPHFCSWMAVGAMSAKFNFAIDSINLDRGEIGGYWKHSVKGTGIGSGSGYLLLQFPKNIAWPAMNPPAEITKQ